MVDISDAVVLRVVSRSSPCIASTAEPARKVPRYRTTKLVMDDTMADEMAFPPIFTALTERGWTFLKKLLRISLNMTMIRVILMPPDVLATHPPMNRAVNSIMWENTGQSM